MNKHIVQRISELKARSYTRFFSIFHAIKPQILFSSFRGNQYSDNQRVISEYIFNNYPEIEINWVLNSNKNPYGLVPSYVKRVKYGTRQFYQALSQSFCFITNNEIRPNIVKRENQLFIQTWHGDRGFKKVLYDDLGETDDVYRSNVVRDNFLTDFCVAGSVYGERRYRSAFRYSGEILKVGMPRNDKLLNFSKNEASEIRKRLGVPENKKLIMYAPTYRDDKKGKACELVNLHEVLAWLERETGDDWVGLYRAHRLGAGIGSDNKVFDVSDYPDASDLLVIADAMITDYSSIAGDFLLLNRPIVLAMFDLDEYKANGRDLNCSLEDCGFAIAKNSQELYNLLLVSVRENRMLGYDKAMKYYNVMETGCATKVVCDRILAFYQKTFGGL
jgi:CDP-glycerol glycerophosphotransferase